jgi:hypothetical protein
MPFPSVRPEPLLRGQRCVRPAQQQRDQDEADEDVTEPT